MNDLVLLGFIFALGMWTGSFLHHIYIEWKKP